MYDYKTEREHLFTESGQRLFIGIRDNVKKMLKISGAFTMGKAMALPAGIGAAGGWEMMACIDRLVELGEIKELPTTGFGQRRVFISAEFD